LAWITKNLAGKIKPCYADSGNLRDPVQSAATRDHANEFFDPEGSNVLVRADGSSLPDPRPGSPCPAGGDAHAWHRNRAARARGSHANHGFVHAGIVATALDNACAGAAFSLMPAGAEILTVEFKLNLLAPAQGDRFVFEGKVVKPGRTLTVCEAQAFAIDGGDEKLIATMSGTLMALFDRNAIKSQ
jgi:uncharacterized protein (TIGR00369 family)